MKNVYIGLLLSCFLLASSLQAVTTTFTDNLGNSWKGFAETSSGVNGFSGSRLFVDNGGSEGIGDNFIALDMGAKLTSTTLSGVLNFSFSNSSTAFYVGINATEAELTNFGGAGYDTFTKGYGLFYDVHGTDDIYVLDRSTNAEFWEGVSNATGESLQRDVRSFENGVDLNFEIVYRSDSGMEATFWRTDQAKPGTADVVFNPSTQPQSSGTNVFFGITDEGRLEVENLNFNSAVPEPSSFVLGLLGILTLVFFKRK